jgi:hypothetical protein
VQGLLIQQLEPQAAQRRATEEFAALCARLLAPDGGGAQTP